MSYNSKNTAPGEEDSIGITSILNDQLEDIYFILLPSNKTRMTRMVLDIPARTVPLGVVILLSLHLRHHCEMRERTTVQYLVLFDRPCGTNNCVFSVANFKDVWVT